MLTIDTATNHVMQSHVRGDGYITMAWPKDLTLRELDYCREVVNLQLDVFRNQARRELDAGAEWDSWIEALRVQAGAAHA